MSCHCLVKQKLSCHQNDKEKYVIKNILYKQFDDMQTNETDFDFFSPSNVYLQ